jgi:rsbT co-antagonist protein RsbR
LIGAVDENRARQLTAQLLDKVRSHRARIVVIDVTGVPQVNTEVANHLVHTAAACRLLGAEVLMSGVSREIAQTFAELGVDMGMMHTVGDLQSGIDLANELLGRSGELPPGSGVGEPASLVSQRDHRIHARGAARGSRAGQERR